MGMRSDARLGEQRVEEGVISPNAVQRSLERQRRLMAIALSSVALLAPLNTKAADTARIQVVASVVARASIESQRLPSHVVVSAEDVARGFVDVPVEIGVRSNHAVMLGFSANSRHVARIDVTNGSAYVAQPAPGMRSQRLSYQLRLLLAPGAQPGRIAFPVSVSLTPA